MAELYLKIGTVGPDPAYQDGDIVDVMNDRRISCAHIEMICRADGLLFGSDGLRRKNSLLFDFKRDTYEYQFEAVSKTEVLRTPLQGGIPDILNNVPNAKGEYIDLGVFLKRREAFLRHSIFGGVGNKTWFGGHSRFDTSILDALWVKIEDRTPERKADHMLWPAGIEDLKHFVVLKIPDMTNKIASNFVDHETKDIVEVKQGMERILTVLIRRRKQTVNWRDMNLGKPIFDFENRNLSVDIRETVQSLVGFKTIKSPLLV